MWIRWYVWNYWVTTWFIKSRAGAFQHNWCIERAGEEMRDSLNMRWKLCRANEAAKGKYRPQSRLRQITSPDPHWVRKKRSLLQQPSLFRILAAFGGSFSQLKIKDSKKKKKKQKTPEEHFLLSSLCCVLSRERRAIQASRSKPSRRRATLPPHRLMFYRTASTSCKVAEKSCRACVGTKIWSPRNRSFITIHSHLANARPFC